MHKKVSSLEQIQICIKEETFFCRISDHEMNRRLVHLHVEVRGGSQFRAPLILMK
jgi:hypothetical protein